MRTFPLVLLAFFCAACQKDDPVAPTEDGYPPATTSAVIGPAGGTIVAEGFSLSVPEGAFATIETLRVTDLRATEEFGVEALTPLYQVDGIPEEFSLPLSIGLELQRTPADGLYLMMGEEGALMFEDGTLRSYEGVPAAFADGHLRTVIPPPSSEAPTTSIRFRGED